MKVCLLQEVVSVVRNVNFLLSFEVLLLGGVNVNQQSLCARSSRRDLDVDGCFAMGRDRTTRNEVAIRIELFVEK